MSDYLDLIELCVRIQRDHWSALGALGAVWEERYLTCQVLHGWDYCSFGEVRQVSAGDDDAERAFARYGAASRAVIEIEDRLVADGWFAASERTVVVDDDGEFLRLTGSRSADAAWFAHLRRLRERDGVDNDVEERWRVIERYWRRT